MDNAPSTMQGVIDGIRLFAETHDLTPDETRTVFVNGIAATVVAKEDPSLCERLQTVKSYVQPLPAPPEADNGQS